MHKRIAGTIAGLAIGCILVACATPSGTAELRATPASAPVAISTSARATATSTTAPTSPQVATTTVGPTSVTSATRAVQYHYRFSEQAVSVSEDGQTWTERAFRFANKVVSLAAAHNDSSTVYVLTFEPLPSGTQLRPAYRYVIMASRDAAQTWQAGASGEIGGCYMVKASLQPLAGSSAPPAMLLLNTQCADSPSDSRGYGMGVRLSTDAGRTFVWSQNGDGIQLLHARDGIVRFVPGNNESTLALSMDQGRTWQPLSLPAQLNNGGYPSAYPTLEVNVNNPAHLTLRERTANQRVWTSLDGGQTWSAQP